jgi:hypothetical protein
MDLSTKEDDSLKLHTKQLSKHQQGMVFTTPRTHGPVKNKAELLKEGRSFKEEIRSLLMIMRVCNEG